jgi:hypothetical protein
MNITDADIDEIQNPTAHNKQILTRHELRVKQAARRLLQDCCGIISPICLIEKVDKAAANLLVEDCLLQYTDDLFEDYDYIDSEGYIKLVPDTVDLIFIGRLIRYDIDPALYFKNITLPKVWKSRLSANGIAILRTMEFYQNLLDSPALESPSDTPPVPLASPSYSSLLPLASPSDTPPPSELSSNIQLLSVSLSNINPENCKSLKSY